MTTVAFVIVDLAGVIRLWSPEAEELFGYESASVVGQLLDVIVPAEFRAQHWAGFHSAVQRGKLKSGRDQVTAILPIVCKDGTVVDSRGRLYLLHDAEDRLVGLAAILSGNDEPSQPRR